MEQGPNLSKKFEDELGAASGELPLYPESIPGTDEVSANREAALEDAADFEQEQRDLADERAELDALHNPPSDPAF